MVFSGIYSGTLWPRATFSLDSFQSAPPTPPDEQGNRVSLKLSDLRDALTESGLHCKVDIVDWAATDERFRNIIDSQAVVLKSGLKHDKKRLFSYRPSRDAARKKS